MKNGDRVARTLLLFALAAGLGGYDYCANGPGARLPPGCYCDGPPPPPLRAKVSTGPPDPEPGAKRIFTTPTPKQPAEGRLSPPPPPNLLSVQQAMNTCLSARLPYWVVTDIQPRYMQMARSGASAAVRSAAPETLPYQTQIFIVETAMALQAQALHDSKYGQNKFDPTDQYDEDNPANAKDYLVGWLDRCVATSGLRPLKDARAPYADFLGVAAKNNNRPLMFGFGYGYGDLLAPASLLPNSTAY